MSPLRRSTILDPMGLHPQTPIVSKPSLFQSPASGIQFVAAGPNLVRNLVEQDYAVFLDLKFHDIPNTVAGACKAAARLGVWMVNVHASGGEAMMRAAREAVDASPRPPRLIAVTVLTSLGDADLAKVGLAGPTAAAVDRLAALAQGSGMDGVVCSAQEASQQRAARGEGFVLVTPGIRLAGDAKGDQVRVVTPTDAVALGAHYLVIGRSITGAADPVATLESIRLSLEGTAA